MSDINRPRRYYLLKRRHLETAEQWDLAAVWQAKQEAEPGALLPVGFPSKDALEGCGYTTVEDVHGADRDELAAFASLRNYQADAVIEAAAALI